MQQGLRAVNQAMGRVIRHRWDYGAVLLADERFGQAQNQRNLSRWLREHVAVHSSFGGAIGSLTKFFKVCGGLACAALSGGWVLRAVPADVVAGVILAVSLRDCAHYVGCLSVAVRMGYVVCARAGIASPSSSSCVSSAGSHGDVRRIGARSSAGTAGVILDVSLRRCSCMVS